MTTTDTATSAEYDPFEEFNTAMGAGTVQNPYPDFIPLREESPVSAIDVREQFGIEVEAEDASVYTVNTFESVQHVLRDNETFSSSGYADIMGQVFGHSILEMDEPEHHTYQVAHPAGLQPQRHDRVGAGSHRAGGPRSSTSSRATATPTSCVTSRSPSRSTSSPRCSPCPTTTILGSTVWPPS